MATKKATTQKKDKNLLLRGDHTAAQTAAYALRKKAKSMREVNDQSKRKSQFIRDLQHPEGDITAAQTAARDLRRGAYTVWQTNRKGKK